MGLGAPLFLGGLLALALPIWLHLLRRQTTEPLPFSSLMFFERRPQSSTKHRRLRYLVLLALRLALLALLAFLFADPYIRTTRLVAGGKKLLVIAVDNSFSMRHAGWLESAKREAESAVARLEPGDLGQVVAVGSQVQLLTQPTSNADELRTAIRAIQPGDSRSSFGEFARFLRSARETLKLPLEAHLASDLQKSGMPPSFQDLRLLPDTKLELHSVGSTSAPNWAVETVTAPRSIFDPKKARIQATIAGYGTEATHRTVSLVANGKTVATKQIDIAASGRASTEFIGFDVPYGFSRCEVRIEPGDALAADDRYQFAVERADPRKILFVQRSPQSRDALYYKAALESGGRGAFQVEQVTPDQAANATLSKYAFVVLADASYLPGGFEDTLKRWANGGGSLLVALGTGSASQTNVPVAGLHVAESRYATREGERFQVASVADPAHPVLRRADALEGVRFYQAVKVDPGSARVLARLGDQTPLLIEQPMGEGKVLVFASGFDNLTNDFPLHASFVPFVERSAAYLGGLGDQSPNLAVDSFVELRSGKSQAAAVEVIDPDGKRALSLDAAAKATNFALNREGFYELRRANGRQEMVAAHADRQESNLAPIPAETLALWKSTGTGDTSPAGSQGGEAGETRSPLWRYFAILLLLVVVAESFLSNRYLAIARDEEPVEGREAA